MISLPAELLERRDEYCRRHALGIQDLPGAGQPFGWGLDAFVWQTTLDSILKVFRHEAEFHQERAVYERLRSRGHEPLRGFQIPHLLDYDEDLWILELSFVRPPYILDFAAATLDDAPPGFDPHAPEWIAEKRRQFGRSWPEVARLLDALRHLGIHYCDVHPENIRIAR